LCVIGSTTAAALAEKVSRAVVAATGTTRPSPSTSPAPAATSAPTTPSLPALTIDHRLVHLHDGGAPVPEVPISAARLGIPNRKWVMVIDLAKCDGCGHCVDACQKMHFTRPSQPWIKVLRMKDSQYTAPYYFPQPCFHCDNPPCTKVCPVDATYKRSDGLVLVDNERCIGCRFCIAGCPYSVRVFNWGHPPDPPEADDQPYSPEHGIPRRIGTVEKCDFCPDMARAGKLPGCASGCPMGAIYFGDQNEDAVTNGLGETARLTALLDSNAAYRHLEELGTEPRVYYLPPKNRMYPAPAPARTGEGT
jgi:molybdopterin-containing oxidoreductase family iron-sulfur binding subunit